MAKRFSVVGLMIAVAVSIAAAASTGYTRSVEAITPNIFRVTYTPDDWQGNEYSPLKLVLDIKDKNMECKHYTVGSTSTIITPAGLSAVLTPNNLVLNAGGKRAIVDPGFPVTENGRRYIRLYPSDHSSLLFGGGERGFHLNMRGDTLVSYNRQNYGYTDKDPRIKQMNITMPLFISDEGYAILFDEFEPSQIVLGQSIEFITENLTSPISYYFISGGDKDHSIATTVKYLSLLTGRQELPPLWSLGYITSKYGYRTQAETEGVIDTLKRQGYPVDGIVLDLYWYGKEQDMGSLSWEKSQWNDHVKMLRNLKKKGVSLIPISQPYVLKNGRGLQNYNDLSEKKMFGIDSLGNTHDVTIWVGEGGMLDVSNPQTVEWLTQRYKKLTDEGVTGWWGDLGEPEVHPETMIHSNGMTARQYHNRYGNDWSELIYNLYKKEYPDTRLMSLMRGGTTGLQRFSVFPWSTDVSRSWGGLQPQIKIMLNAGLSGLGYMSHDVGGFAVDPANPTDPELYVRWLQLGLFSPILRTHAQQMAEPYKYPEYQDIIKPIVLERYRWLPYNYTLAYENSTAGMPLVRLLDYENQSPLNSVTDQYRWGRDVMVAPVLHPGVTGRTVLIPEGEWIDFADPAKIYNGGDTVSYPVELSTLPLFVRAGAFIPTADYKMKNTGDYTTANYTINYYPRAGVTLDGKIYEDDLKTPSHADKAFALIKFDGTTTEEGDTLTSVIKISADTQGSFNPLTKKLTFKVYNVGKPISVCINPGELKDISYNPGLRILSFTIPAYKATENREIKIVYNK